MIKRWLMRDGTLSLQGSLRAPGPVQRLKPMPSGWVAAAGQSVLMIQPDDTIAFRFDVGKTVGALDISPGGRYIAAVTGGEIIVIDIVRSAIATMIIGVPEPRQVRFLDAVSLAFSQVFAINVAQVDKLDYIPFAPTSMSHDSAAF